MAQVGRKTKLTPAVQELIMQALSVGATHRITCEYAGISQETLYTWLDKGREGKEPYLEFFEQFTRTQGRTAVKWLAQIEQAASQGDWRALAWKLERRYPQEFSATAKVEHGMDPEKPLVIVMRRKGQ
jgi:hypothetical protein